MTDLVARLRSHVACEGGDLADVEQAADEIERLRAEAEAYKERIAGLVNVGHALAATIEKQRAEVEALRADAERYRWLRDRGDSMWAPLASRVKGGAQQIDAAIDAARKA